jgi:ADP-glucose pyrophosphorylase
MTERITGFIPAGGEGVRLQPLTAEHPKPHLLMGSGDKRLIDYPLQVLPDGSNLIVSVGYQGNKLIDHLKHRYENIKPIILQDSKLSNIGGSLAQHFDLVERELSDFTLIIPADHVIEGLNVVQLQREHEERGSEITVLAVKPLTYGDYLHIDDSGSVRAINGLQPFSTTRYSSTGIYLFNTSFLLQAIRRRVKQGWQGEEYDITKELVFPSIEKGRVSAHILEENGYWDDSGTLARYFVNNMRLSCGENVIAPSSNIHDNAVLKNSIVLDNAIVGDVVIKNSILAPNAQVNVSNFSMVPITVYSKEGGKKHVTMEED